MNLNLPILNQLCNCKNLLIAGMGGGYDIFCGLPIYFELRRLGIKAHLANLSFSNIIFSQAAKLQQTIRLIEQHLFLSQFLATETLADVLQEMLKVMQKRPRRIAEKIPLP